MSQEMVKAKTVQVEDILIAYQQLKDIVAHTPLQKNERLSEKYQCNVYLKEKTYNLFVHLNLEVPIIRSNRLKMLRGKKA